jgi:hypothetical protein
MFICRSRAVIVPPHMLVASVTTHYSSKICELGMTLNDMMIIKCTPGYITACEIYGLALSSKLMLKLFKALVTPQFLFGDVLF